MTKRGHEPTSAVRFRFMSSRYPSCDLPIIDQAVEFDPQTYSPDSMTRLANLAIRSAVDHTEPPRRWERFRGPHTSNEVCAGIGSRDIALKVHFSAGDHHFLEYTVGMAFDRSITSLYVVAQKVEGDLGGRHSPQVSWRKHKGRTVILDVGMPAKTTGYMKLMRLLDPGVRTPTVAERQVIDAARQADVAEQMISSGLASSLYQCTRVEVIPLAD